MEQIGRNEGTSKKYSISADKFREGRTTLTKVEDYHFPNEVTRANFASFLTDWFSRSRGQQANLWIQLAWLDAHTGFDFKKTFNNFFEADGVASLAPVETEHFTKKYNDIGAHLPIDLPIALTMNMMDILDPKISSTLEAEFPPDFVSHATRSELFETIDNYVRSKKQISNT